MRLKVQDLYRFGASDFGFRIWGYGVATLGLEFRVEDFGFRAQDKGQRASNFGV